MVTAVALPLGEMGPTCHTSFAQRGHHALAVRYDNGPTRGCGQSVSVLSRLRQTPAECTAEDKATRCPAGHGLPLPAGGRADFSLRGGGGLWGGTPPSGDPELLEAPNKFFGLN